MRLSLNDKRSDRRCAVFLNSVLCVLIVDVSVTKNATVPIQAQCWSKISMTFAGSFPVSITSNVSMGEKL